MASRTSHDADLIREGFGYYGATYNTLGNLVISDRQYERLHVEMQHDRYLQDLQAMEKELPPDINEQISGALVNLIGDSFSLKGSDSDEKLDLTKQTVFMQMHLSGKDVSDELYGCTVVVPTNGQAVEVQNGITKWGAYVPRGSRIRRDTEDALCVEVEPVLEPYDGSGNITAIDNVVEEHRVRKNPLEPANAWQKLELLEILQRLSSDEVSMEPYHRSPYSHPESMYSPTAVTMTLPGPGNVVTYTQAS